MTQYPDWLTVFCALGFVAGNIFSLTLFFYGVIRTGLWFFYVMVFVAAFGTLLAVVNTVIYYNPPLAIHTLGYAMYRLLFYGYIYSTLGNFILLLLGWTIIVRWICRAYMRLGDAGV
jgi:hypothetical protein